MDLPERAAIPPNRGPRSANDHHVASHKAQS